ncbi:MAG: cytochrome c oxidase subunit II [Verrucomicrobiales bacterium]
MNELLGLPPLTSVEGAGVDKMILFVHYLMGALFIGWFAYFLYVIFRFRNTKNPRANAAGVQSHASSYLEVAVAAIEGVLLIGMAIPLWAKAADGFPPDEKSTVIRVIAEQFQWSARYPGPDGKFGKQDFRLVSPQNPLGIDPADPLGADDATSTMNDIVVPVNKPVIAHISSKDVIHSFQIKPMRVTQDAIPGMSIPIWFTPNRVGEYMITCAQLCGNSHYYMKGFFRVVSQDDFNTYISERNNVGAAAAGGFE